MKTILLAFGLMLSLQSISQIDSTYDKTAGDQLIKFSKVLYTGVGIAALGAGIMYMSGQTPNSETVLLGGIVVTAIGSGVMLFSFSYLGSAGRLMNLQVKNEGLTVSYRF